MNTQYIASEVPGHESTNAIIVTCDPTTAAGLESVIRRPDVEK